VIHEQLLGLSRELDDREAAVVPSKDRKYQKQLVRGRATRTPICELHKTYAFCDAEGRSRYEARRNQVAGGQREDGERRRVSDIAIFEMQLHEGVHRRENRLQGPFDCLAYWIVPGSEHYLAVDLIERLRIQRHVALLNNVLVAKEHWQSEKIERERAPERQRDATAAIWRRT
jgi:hypothetical protein